MKITLLRLLFITFFTVNVIDVSAQGGVAISPSSAAPAPSAMLDVQSTNKGLLIPRLTQGQRDLILNPDLGLQIYNTTTNCINLWNGISWRQMCGSCDFNDPVAGNNGPICQGQTLNLSATSIAGATYQWAGPNGFSSTLQNPSITNASAAASGSYSVIATVNGCSSQMQTTFATVNATPQTPAATATPGTACEGNTVNLSATLISGANYSWTGPGGFTSNLQSPVINNIQVSDAGTYNVTANVSGCTSATGSVAVAVNPNPSATFSFFPNPAVAGSPLTFTPATTGGTYNWVFSGGSPASSTAQSPAITYSNAGTYNVLLTVTANGCSSNSTSSFTIVGGPFSFTTCGQSGQDGPSQAQCNTAYTSTPLASNVTVTSGIQYWTVPATGTYRIEAFGARSGYDNAGGASDVGLGARMRGDFALTAGTVLKILVGQPGANNTSSSSAAGGGGTFVATNSNTPLIVAGGGGAYEGNGFNANQNGSISTSGNNGAGGGAYAGGTGGNGATQDDNDNHGGGGAGFNSDGVGVGQGTTHQTPARSFINGGRGGEPLFNNVWGGFGGGGGAWGNGGGSGGGGGYSGGGAGDNASNASGGGGGSYNSGTNQSNSPGVNNGAGSVVITYVGP